ncbi:neuropeptide receptor npr-1-like [Hydractinia symbiolongicarpus]|uniref:neuropeptide receptor npr-1-like n=1 Tax=Hydractinia symbiolongicarpus TaxID=13093 RepID=UPI00254FB2C5|nr:neuropeptide receptor npr-1-like [Hydractinia symbiolongicarpus]
MTSIPNTTTATPNVGEYEDPTIPPFPAKVTMIIAYCFIFLLGTIGNATVVYIVAKSPRKRTMSDTLLLSLSVIDLLGSINVPFIMIYDLLYTQWYFGSVLCKIIPSMNTFTLCGSAWSLAFIALDRLRIILFPFNARVSPTKKVATVILIWLIAIVITFPYANNHVADETGCWARYDSLNNQYVYVAIFCIVTCVIPTIIMTISYVISTLKMKKTVKVQTTRKASVVRKEQSQRLTKMFALIVGVFVILTTPYLIFLFTFMYYATYRLETFMEHRVLLSALNYALFTFAAFNSCVNCVIYAKMHTGVKTFYRTMRRSVRTASVISSLSQDNTAVTHETAATIDRARKKSIIPM